jgi:hypothetical protein
MTFWGGDLQREAQKRALLRKQLAEVSTSMESALKRLAEITAELEDQVESLEREDDDSDA